MILGQEDDVDVTPLVSFFFAIFPTQLRMIDSSDNLQISVDVAFRPIASVFIAQTKFAEVDSFCRTNLRWIFFAILDGNYHFPFLLFTSEPWSDIDSGAKPVIKITFIHRLREEKNKTECKFLLSKAFMHFWVTFVILTGFSVTFNHSNEHCSENFQESFHHFHCLIQAHSSFRKFCKSVKNFQRTLYDLNY